MLLASHPAPVREAIERHRTGLDRDPVQYLEANSARLTREAREAAGQHLGVNLSHIALTDSTTMGVGLIYGGLRLRVGDDILTTTEDYFVTHESLRLAAARSGAKLRKIALFDSAAEASADETVNRIRAGIRPETRLVALTWVHSSTGFRIPVADVAAMLAELNAEREEDDQVLLGLDAVHGLGVEIDSFGELGCDFFMAGCHKWLFGPRGTGIAAISRRGLTAVRPVVPSFDDDPVFAAWLEDRDTPSGRNDGPRMTPGGFKDFEHRWALTDAFQIQQQIGRDRITARTHNLAAMLKEGLRAIPGVILRTPRDSGLSAGIVSFDVDGYSADNFVSRLRDRNIIASAAPYATQHVRLTPSIRNSEDEIERVLAVVRDLA
jgi:selenocysteine lyase/cysteine desulfurase